MNPLSHFLSHTRLWIIPAGLIWITLLVLQNELGYFRFQTVDAGYYQELAQDFITGRQMVLDGLVNAKGNSFSPYPPGYPVLLGIFSWLEGSAGWLNHVLLHAAIGLFILMIWQQSLSLLPLAFVFFTDTVLSLAATGISEFSFTVFAILAVFSLTKLEQRGQWQWELGLTASLCLCCWTRYAAVFFLVFMAFKLWRFFQISPKKAAVLLWPCVYFSAFMLVMFVSQWMETELFTGGDRYPNSDSVGLLVKHLTIEIFNQLFFFRNIAGASVYSIILGAFLSLGMIWLIIREPFSENGPGFQAADENHSSFVELLSRNLILAGFLYLAFMIPLRWYYYFAEPYDNRLLGPGFTLLLLGWAVSKEASIYRQPLLLKLFFLLTAIVFFLPDPLKLFDL